MPVVTMFGMLSAQEHERMRESEAGVDQFIDGTLSFENTANLSVIVSDIAWLLSPLKRYEADLFPAPIDAAKIAALDRPELLMSHPSNELLIALEGRGRTDDKLDSREWPVSVILEPEVKKFTSILSAIDESILRKELDFEKLDTASEQINHWADHGEDIFQRFILPGVAGLQSLYATASKQNQRILIWCEYQSAIA